MESAADGEQVAEVVEKLGIERLFTAAHRIGHLDVSHGGERGQQVEFLKNESDTVLAEARTLGVVEGGEIDAVNDDCARW